MALNSELHGIRAVNRIAGEINGSTMETNLAIDMPIWGTQTSGEHGTTLTGAAARSRNTYMDLGWEFGPDHDRPWRMEEGTGYPVLYFTR